MSSNKILFKVYTIWFLRRIVPLMLLQIAILVVFLKLLASKVFFGKVIENASLAAGANYWAFFKYLAGAFFQTSVVVQLSVFLALGVGALLLRDLAKIVKNYLKTFARNK